MQSQPSKVVVHTIRFGKEWWMKLCTPTQDAWCERHGHTLRVWTKEEINPAYPSAKFCEIDMLREFLSGDAEWLFYVDADVFVSDDAPALPAEHEKGGFFIRPGKPSTRKSNYPQWCSERFGVGMARIIEGWKYSNAGVWLCDRDSARRLLHVIAPPYFEGVQEQNQLNWWLCLAARTTGLKVHELLEVWNRHPTDTHKAYFYHWYGDKFRGFKAMREQGLITADPKPKFPPQYDFEKYRFTLNGHNAMDEYHIHVLHAAALLGAPIDGGENIAVEIGSYRGASTSALIEAVNKGAVTHLHVVEIGANETLLKVISMCDYPERVTLHTKPSWETAIPRADLVFIDGDHKWPALADTLWALSKHARIICMHDSKSWPRIPGTWGAVMASRMLSDIPGRHVFEDCEDRPFLATFRGFFISATEDVDLSAVRAIECE